MTLRFTRLPVNPPFTISAGYLQPITTHGTTRIHLGIDFAVPTGTPVYAPAGGTLTYPTLPAWGDGSFGVVAIIDHPGTPYYSLYAHLSRVDTRVRKCEVGDLIGYSGNSGMSTGPHLHWQVSDSYWFPRTDGRHFDPMSFLQIEEDIAVENKGPTGEQINDALQARFAIIRLALDPDIVKVNKALDILVERGFLNRP